MKQNNENLFYLILKGKKEEFFENFNILLHKNAIDEFNMSLLQDAISNNQIEIAEFLIKNKCNIDHQDSKKNLVLDYILASNNEERYFLVEILLDLDARLDLENIYGNQPLWTAVMNAKVPLSIIEKLLEKGADPHHKNAVGKSPYDMVLEFNIKELTDLFEPYI